MVAKSRAEYFKRRRENGNIKQFNVSIDKKMADLLEEKLSQQNKTKKSWLEEKISEELQK